MQRPLPVSQSLHSPHRLYRLCEKLGLSITCFRLGKSHPPRAFPLLEDSEFLMMLLSLTVIPRSCIASLKVLNYDLEDHLKKVYDCVRLIQTTPMVWASFAHSRCPWSIRVQTHQNAFLSSQICRLRVVPHFSSGIVERAKRERAWKSPHARKTRRVLLLLAWGEFHARSRFAPPSIPEEKWGTTRSLTNMFLYQPSISCLKYGCRKDNFIL